MARKLTHDEFLKKLANLHIDNIDIVGAYVNSRTDVKCRCKMCGHIFDRLPSVLLKSNQCPKCMERKPKYTEEEVIHKLDMLNKGLKMIGKYVNVSTKTDFECSKHHIWPARPIDVLNSNHGCPYCAHIKPWIGETDLWTTRPDVAKMLENPDDGYKYMRATSKKVKFVCPTCGYVSDKNIKQVCENGFFCQKCSDGVSYPNKFGRAFLDQLPITNHICEYQPKWSGRYSYDNYFEYNNRAYILEMDGGLHTEDGVLLGKSLEERQAIDKAKTDDAVSHGMCIIRINCDESNVDFIKNNILNSPMNVLFNLSSIDWELCDKKSQSNLVKSTCEMYSSGEHDLSKIANNLHICVVTVREYLKRGFIFGWCDYDVEKIRQQSYINSRHSVVLLDNCGDIVKKFDGVSNNIDEISTLCGVTMTYQGILKSCKTYKPYKGFNFRYADEYTTK